MFGVYLMVSGRLKKIRGRVAKGAGWLFSAFDMVLEAYIILLIAGVIEASSVLSILDIAITELGVIKNEQ